MVLGYGEIFNFLIRHPQWESILRWTQDANQNDDFDIEVNFA